VIAHYCPTITLCLAADEAAEAHRLMARMEDLGAEACGSPAHREAVAEWGDFCARVAVGNAARGDIEGWDWAPSWRLRPRGLLPDLPDLVRLLWQDLAQRWCRRQVPPKRAEVVPIRQRSE